MGMYASLFALPEPLLDQLFTDPAARDEWLGDLGELDSHGLDKLWHGVHYMLCGSADATAEPLGRAIIGGAPLPGPDLGYGPPLSLRCAEVAAIAGAMATLSAEAFAARFDPDAMVREGVYPTIWSRDADTVVDELVTAYVSLRDYYERAALAGLAMLTWVA